MNTETISSMAIQEDQGIKALAPRPTNVEDTGLTAHFLAELFVKHINDAGLLTLKQLMQRLALSGPVIEEVINFLRKEVLIEVHSRGFEHRELHYGLTQRGRDYAFEALAKSGYTGPVPVPIEHYRSVVAAQSIHNFNVTRDKFYRAFSKVTLKAELKDQLGPALNSGRAIFIYGPAGTGKTYITQKMLNLFDDSCLIPYALEIDGSVVSLFDPLIHRPVEEIKTNPNLRLNDDYDARFVRCERPVVITGGELGMEMLEVNFNPVLKEYQAPLQLKANNGMFIIDDMGRQRATPMEIFNRWIVPLEEHKDYLTLGAGKHVQTPFDQVVVFSSNINPLDLADEAFLRRIGYKVYFGFLEPDQYEQIWRQECGERDIPFNPELLHYVLYQLHGAKGVALRPCHPRDLLGMAWDRFLYQGGEGELMPEHLDWAWNSYFVSIDQQKQMSEF
ncbi:AAA family ATPase [Pontibacterium granulatum]|uniref:AAA family ATPase n=1 Tax=Pontibacterium granulatum TaxID=2036029 RepID=UPI00249BF724|nr:AAA family ATPase [Pontibacterium granulatum]MDI3323804.1 AAA family ATPase [Pontibacterium granulatum]